MQPPPTPNSYADVFKRILRRMRAERVDDQLLEILVRAFEKELNQETASLSRPQRKQLLREAAEALFDDVFGKMENTA